MQLGRFHQAWLDAKEQVAFATRRRAEGLPDEDLDAPLPSPMQAAIEKDFREHYRYVCDSECFPWDAMVARLKREHDKTLYGVYPLRRVRSQASTASISASKSKDIGGGVRFTYTDSTQLDTDIVDIIDFLDRIQLLLTGYAAIDVDKVILSTMTGVEESVAIFPLASYCYPERGLNIWLAYRPLAAYCYPERGLNIWLAYRPLASYCHPIQQHTLL